MKRNIVIATVAAAALIGGGAVAAYASGDDDGAATQRQSSVRITDDRDDRADDLAEDAADDRDDRRDDDGRDDDGAEVRSQAGAGKVTAADAIAAALRHTPGTAVSAEQDDDRSGVWEVSIAKGDGSDHDVKVSASDGKVLGAHRDDDDDDVREDLAALKGASVDAREAAGAVAAKGVVTEVDLDDDGPAAWKVETTKGEWQVDLKSGEVTQRHDDGDDD